ncbi:invasion associated locus B family protein [Roseiterribacter gracilis]|uniref:Invasion associated locus B family protein n=1 Tax=Roseiterribacter gracilis TaxID=2812848 RepID=A0A8S8XGZ1_9PROT|nr:hypothetical protein TMPK1_27730 [Rhodospirillales bacterium TMPK1]
MFRYASLVLAAFLVPALAQAQTEPVPKGTYGDWSIYSYREKGGPVCYAAAKLPPSTNGAPKRTGWVMITHRPGEKTRGVVSVLPGYTFKDRSTALVSVGGKQFTLYTQGDTAWAADADDPRLVEAIRTSGLLAFTGTTKDGAAQVDNFSLGGAAAAFDALDKSCTGGAAPKKTSKKKK